MQKEVEVNDSLCNIIFNPVGSKGQPAHSKGYLLASGPVVSYCKCSTL